MYKYTTPFIKSASHLKSLTIIVCLVLLFEQAVLAHPGGHYKKGDVLNTWTLMNGQTVKGNFFMNKGNLVVLEQWGGKYLSIPFNELSKQDQLLAGMKIRRLALLNEGLAAPEIQPTTPSQYVNLRSIIGFLTVALLMVVIFWKSETRKSLLSRKYATGNWAIACLLIFFSILACKKSTDSGTTVGSTASSNISIPKTTTGFLDSVYSPFKPTVSTRWDDTYFYIAANGIPAHNMMVGITSWQQQVPIPQFYTGTNSWSIPLQPVYAAVPMSTKSNFMKGAVAVAINGIPIFNALNNRGEDSYMIGELDQWGGHCGKADDYHYHAAPLHLSTSVGLKPIAFALDGFAVYGDKEADGSSMQSLDTCHGHMINNGVYHYHGTATYPYVVGAMKGKVTIDPSTPAPENQILPQAMSSPLRPATNPLNGAVITAFNATGTNAYSLTYKIGTKTGSVVYSWDAANKYTFTLTDTAGKAVTNSYQR
jgi:hypothetical protein